MQVIGLKVDHLHRPLGLGNRSPRLSWRIESDKHNVRQRAYRILVATNEDALHEGQGDLWDTGQVHSGESLGISYQGRELTSRQRCWWAVEIWAESGDSARSSGEDCWEMGLLAPSDWSAQWLAVEDRIARADRETGLCWIWGEEAPPDIAVHGFRSEFNLSEPALRGNLIAAVRQTMMWGQITRIWLDGVAIAGPGSWIDGYLGVPAAGAGTTISNLTLQDLALGQLAPGPHLLAIEVGTRPVSAWLFATKETPPLVPGLAALLRVELESGGAMRFASSAEWKTHSGELDHGWHEPGFDDTLWSKACVNRDDPYQPFPARPAMHLRHRFSLNRPVQTARLYATALGVYEACLNGREVGDQLLAPGPSQYDRRVHYQVHDVTAFVRQGENVMALTVADGWYADYEGRFAWAEPPRRVIAQLEVTYEDGTQQIVATGPGWRIAESSVRSSRLRFGEIHDRRLSQTGWDQVGFDDAHWELASMAEKPDCELTAQYIPPIRVDRCFKPKRITTLENGAHVIDFGICFAGWCELIVTGSAGAIVELTYSEVVDSSGRLDSSSVWSSCGQPRRDVFILSGVGAERLRPRFTYHGLRYVQVAGLAIAPAPEQIEGVFIRSDLEPTADVRSDVAIIKDIFALAIQTQKNCFIGVPLDNNTREARGYTGEMGGYGETACYLMDLSTFFAHHVDCSVDGRNADGTFPLYAPRPRLTTVFPQASGDAPGGGHTVLWELFFCWRHYADTTGISRHWDALSRFSQFILEHNPSHLWVNKRVFDFGDWLALEPTPHDLFATAVWARSAAMMAELAHAVGRHEEADHHETVWKRIAAAFNATFVRSDGTIGNGSQTSYALPLAFGLIPLEQRRMAANRLGAAIHARAPASLTTGTWGTSLILDALADNGHTDLAYDLLTRTAFPSWGYMLQQGATAIWEYWDGKKGTRSQPAFGSVAGFIVRRIAGIEAAAPGFAKIIIRPLADTRLRAAGGQYRSAMGLIATDWQRSHDGVFRLDLLIPANAQAQVYLPTSDAKLIQESGKSVLSRPDIRIVSQAGNKTSIEVGSGRFLFETS